jgi:hypothetical protein
MPHSIAAFVEDEGHRLVVGPLVNRIALEEQLEIETVFYNATGGRGKVFDELTRASRDIQRGKIARSDIFVAAVDGNCEGFVAIKRRIEERIGTQGPSPILVTAVPNPHVERWLLADSAAFKAVLGVGCSAPDQKCERDRYKQLLADAVRESGLRPVLHGLEHAEDIIAAMDFQRAGSVDEALGRFISDLRAALRRLAV